MSHYKALYKCTYTTLLLDFDIAGWLTERPSCP